MLRKSCVKPFHLRAFLFRMEIMRNQFELHRVAAAITHQSSMLWRRIVRWGCVLLPLLLVCGLLAPSAQALTEEQRLVNEIWRVVDRSYVDPSFNHQNWWALREKTIKQTNDDRAHTYELAQGMLAKLEDPFTRVMKPEQYRSLQTNTAGELTGVGLQISQEPETKQLKVIAPIAGSPAEKAGIQPADLILQIDGRSAIGVSLDEAAAWMRGKAGTVVNLQIQRGEQPQDYDLVRARIELNPVIADLRQVPGKKIGYIRLNQFNANATAEFAEALKQLEKKGADGYILDLRNNPGGLLQAGVAIARNWMDEGAIVYTVSRSGALDSYEADGTALTTDPLVVLVNKGTASASEILAGALQDNGRGVLVGEQTFGKGLIQSLFDLSDGSGLAVTVAKYETPSHRDINKLGITPDRVIPMDEITPAIIGTDADPQYLAAVEVLTKGV
jgi:carboxyl-terminal processing protease